MIISKSDQHEEDFAEWQSFHHCVTNECQEKVDEEGLKS
jgi:hypothetical protein